jgi:hypothetical protein
LCKIENMKSIIKSFQGSPHPRLKMEIGQKKYFFGKTSVKTEIRIRICLQRDHNLNTFSGHWITAILGPLGPKKGLGQDTDFEGNWVVN